MQANTSQRDRVATWWDKGYAYGYKHGMWDGFMMGVGAIITLTLVFMLLKAIVG